MPYTNVLWIRYIHHWLKQQTTKLPKVSNSFLKDTKEFEKKLVPRSVTTDGSFNTAEEVLEFMRVKGWVTEEQTNNDSSILSDA
jgi:hypothetical protein